MQLTQWSLHANETGGHLYQCWVAKQNRRLSIYEQLQFYAEMYTITVCKKTYNVIHNIIQST